MESVIDDILILNNNLMQTLKSVEEKKYLANYILDLIHSLTINKSKFHISYSNDIDSVLDNNKLPKRALSN